MTQPVHTDKGTSIAPIANKASLVARIIPRAKANDLAAIISSAVLFKYLGLGQYFLCENRLYYKAFLDAAIPVNLLPNGNGTNLEHRNLTGIEPEVNVIPVKADWL